MGARFSPPKRVGPQPAGLPISMGMTAVQMDLYVQRSSRYVEALASGSDVGVALVHVEVDLCQMLILLNIAIDRPGEHKADITKLRAMYRVLQREILPALRRARAGRDASGTVVVVCPPEDAELIRKLPAAIREAFTTLPRRMALEASKAALKAGVLNVLDWCEAK